MPTVAPPDDQTHNCLVRICGQAGGFLKDRNQAGQIRAVLHRRYQLDAIADAYRHIETGQKVGIVVIDVVPAEERAATR